MNLTAKHKKLYIYHPLTLHIQYIINVINIICYLLLNTLSSINLKQFNKNFFVVFMLFHVLTLRKIKEEKKILVMFQQSVISRLHVMQIFIVYSPNICRFFYTFFFFFLHSILFNDLIDMIGLYQNHFFRYFYQCRIHCHFFFLFLDENPLMIFNNKYIYTIQAFYIQPHWYNHRIFIINNTKNKKKYNEV